MWVDIAIMVVKTGMVIMCLLFGVAVAVYIERKGLGHIQDRVGPMRVGFHGILQPFADVFKLLLKEELIPSRAQRLLFVMAPALSLWAALSAFAVVPFGREITLFGRDIPLTVANVDLGVIYILAISSLAVYGTMIAGWSSENKYSLLGGIRASAQMISYELPMGLALVSVFMLAGTFNMTGIIEAQKGLWFVIMQPVAFLIFLVGAFAETNRTPFDLPEAENELVAGYLTEYSSMKYSMFFMAEYIHMITISALAATVFFGGWRGPFLPPIFWFLIKTFAFVWFFVWVRGTMPRLRYDQLMNFGWKVLLPLSLLNILVTGLIVAVRGG
jgi:NADH-quinone oxidoreductase subunit H